MSEETPENLKGTVAKLAEKVESLESTVDSLREENERLREENERLRDRVDDLEGTTDWLTGWVDDLEEITLGDYGLAVADREREENGGVLERLESLESDVANVDVDGAGAGGSGDGPAPEQSPMEQIANLPREVAKRTLNQETDKRARWLWNHWETTSTGTPNGSMILARDARRALQQWETEKAEEQDRIPPNVESKMVKRVFERIATLTGGVVETRKQNGEWRLFRPKDWKDDVRDRADVARRDAPEAIAGAAATGE